MIAFFLLRSVGLFGGGNVTVPNVVGQTARAATQTLQGDHLAVGTTTFRTSTTAKGLVLSTDPKSGASVSKNSAVALVISDGPNIPTVQVPSVTGEQLAPALQKLTAANLTYTVKYVNSNQPTGTVLSQIPAGGSSVKANVKVQLTVSGTQTSVQVPSVVGQSPAAAGLHPQGGRPQRGQPVQRLLQPALRIGVLTEPRRRRDRAPEHADQPRRVQRQLRHGAGCGRAEPERRAVVHHLCGTGPQHHLRHHLSGRGEPGTVDNQNPSASTQVASGSTVTISVCQGATTTSSPPSTSSTSSTTSSTTSTTGHARRSGGGNGDGG